MSKSWSSELHGERKVEHWGCLGISAFFGRCASPGENVASSGWNCKDTFAAVVLLLRSHDDNVVTGIWRDIRVSENLIISKLNDL